MTMSNTTVKKRGTPLWIKEQQEHAKMLAPPPFDLPREPAPPSPKALQKDRQHLLSSEGQLEYSSRTPDTEELIRPTCKELGNGHTFEASINFSKRKSQSKQKFSTIGNIRQVNGNGQFPGTTPLLNTNVNENMKGCQKYSEPLNTLSPGIHANRYSPLKFDMLQENRDLMANSEWMANLNNSPFPDSYSHRSSFCPSPRVSFGTASDNSEIISVHLQRQKSDHSKLNHPSNHLEKSEPQSSTSFFVEYFPPVAVRDTKLTAARKKKSKMGLDYICRREQENNKDMALRDEKRENVHCSSSANETLANQPTEIETLVNQQGEMRGSQCASFQENCFTPINELQEEHDLAFSLFDEPGMCKSQFQTHTVGDKQTMAEDPLPHLHAESMQRKTHSCGENLLEEEHDLSSSLFGEPGTCEWQFQKYRVEDKQTMVEDLLPHSHSESMKRKTLSCEKPSSKAEPLCKVTNDVLANVDTNSECSMTVDQPKGRRKNPQHLLPQYTDPPFQQCDLNNTQYTDKQRRSMIKNAVRLFESITASVTHIPWSKKNRPTFNRKQLNTSVTDDDVSEVSAYLA